MQPLSFASRFAYALAAIRKAGVGRVTAVLFPLVFLIYILSNEILVSSVLRSDSLSPTIVPSSPKTLNATTATQSAADDAAAALYARSVTQQRRWSGRQPSWCSALIRSPRPGHSDCGRSRFRAVCSDGEPRFFSRGNQDLFLWMHHWRHLHRRGTYVDISAKEPVRFSNTYFYDRCLGWNGVCVEAEPIFHPLLTRYRSCALVSTCVSDRMEKVELSVRDRNMAEHHMLNVTCQRTTVALRAVIAGAVTHIDMLSLSAQGREFRVLSGIDWERTKINVIVIETVSSATEKLFETLGYKQLLQSTKNANTTDSVFLHKDVIWGKPA